MQLSKMPRWVVMGLLAILLTLLTVGATLAQSENLRIAQFRIASGGVAQGGGYTVRSAIGQADAGALTGGGYRLMGGFLIPFVDGPAGAERDEQGAIYLPMLNRDD
jgi:uncharacterized membrane protein